MTNLSLHLTGETMPVARGLVRLAAFVALFVGLTALLLLLGA